MSEIHNPQQLADYVRKYQLADVFSEQMRPHLTLHQFAQGERIFSQGEPAQRLYLLVFGKIKIYTHSWEGKTLVLAFKTPLDVIGDLEYVRDMEIINTVEAVSPVHLIGIHYQWLKKYGANHPPFLQFLLDHMTRKFYDKAHSFHFHLLYPVEVRVASYLLSVSFDETNDHFHGQLRSAELSDTANLLGTSYRHLNRVLQKLSSAGLIERSKGVILVKDKEKLRALAHQNIYETGWRV